jgi:hypothetical protein
VIKWFQQATINTARVKNMTEAEKRELALQFMAQEQARLASSTFRDHRTAFEAETHQRIATRQQYYNDFAQNGITFQEFQQAYNSAYEQGRSDMLAYRFSFFYAATAIAYSEIFAATPEETASFMKALPHAPEGCENHAELVQRCVEETGFDPSFADEKKAEARVTRRDRAAVDRMRKTGITERDLEIEREEGYRDGRNEPFYLSSCYASVAITLKREQGCDAAEIESFLDRVAEICDEEISVEDIVERARKEAGVDITGLAGFIASATP